MLFVFIMFDLIVGLIRYRRIKKILNSEHLVNHDPQDILSTFHVLDDLDEANNIVILDLRATKKKFIADIIVKRRVMIHDFDPEKQTKGLSEMGDDKISIDLFIIGVQTSMQIFYNNFTTIHWNRQQMKWQLTCCDIPREWFLRNNFVHEVALWFDGTAIFTHHTTTIGMISNM